MYKLYNNYIVLIHLFPTRLFMLKLKSLIIAFLLLSCIVAGACQEQQNFTTSLNEIIDPYRFSIVEWELKTLSYELEDVIFNEMYYTVGDSEVVLEYFSLTGRISGLENQISILKDSIGSDDLNALKTQLEALKEQRDSLRNGTEYIIEQQIRETLRQLDIYIYNNTDIDITIDFPPVNFALESPPYLLIVSPRDSIERMEEIILLQDLTLDEIDYIESEIDKLGYSSIVVKLGGMATFPSFVTNNSGLQFTINTAVEQWLHQYLFFKPAGFLYALNLLGVHGDSDISVINETVAGIASDEIGSILYQNYYARYFEDNSQNNADNDSDDVEFDFYKEMRNIRIAVDNYLSEGEIDRAESFMEEKRLYILSQGYYVRRLNQAYFAFYGTYASSASSVNPIGEMLWKLRGESSSITEFLGKTSSITNLDDLINILE